MAFHWDPALREREGEESVTAVPAFSRSLNGALTGGEIDMPQIAPGFSPPVSALSGEGPWRIGVLLGSHPCASVPATGPGASSPLSALSGRVGSRVAVAGLPETRRDCHPALPLSALDKAGHSCDGMRSGSGGSALAPSPARPAFSSALDAGVAQMPATIREGRAAEAGSERALGHARRSRPGTPTPASSALDDAAAPQPAGALPGSPAAIDDDTSLGRVAASSSAPALSPGVELSRLPLWGALPFMAVLDAVRTRP